MADPNHEQTAGLPKLQANDHFALHANDAALAADVSPGAMKNPSLSQRFENSPLDQAVVDVPHTESQSRCGYLGAVKLPYVCLLRKIGAEIISTFILVFTGCGAAVVDAKSHGVVTHVGVSLSFGIVIMVMVYAVGHISGAHMNPAVTIAFATVRHFPWKDVPFYIGGQVVAAICAGFSLRIIFGDHAHLGATLPAGSNSQSFFLEVIITFILMFVVSAVATDTRAVGELAGIAVGSTVALNALFAGPISGASMNPARSLGPAVAANDFRAIWVYLVGPTVGAVFGAWGYNLVRGSQPTLMELEALKTAKSFKR
ncbi:unnamed protein product [Calypogeia fissa]